MGYTFNPITGKFDYFKDTDISGLQVYHGIQTTGTISFDNTTHVVTLAAGTNTYWYSGTQYTTSSAITCDLDDYISLTANTLYFVYFNDATGTLKAGTTAWSILADVPVCLIFWNGSAGIIMDERHDYRRDLQWHNNAHNTIGTRYGSGLGLTHPTTSTDSQLQIEAGVIWDEDIKLTITQQTTARHFYKVSASVFTFANISAPYDTTVKYLNTSTYTLTDVSTGSFIPIWVYATGDIDRPIWIIPYHGTAAFTTQALAEAAAPPSLSGLNISPEIKLLYRLVYKGDDQLQSTADYRTVSSLPGGVVAGTVPGGGNTQYQYNNAGSFAGGELERTSSTVTTLNHGTPTHAAVTGNFRINGASPVLSLNGQAGATLRIPLTGTNLISGSSVAGEFRYYCGLVDGDSYTSLYANNTEWRFKENGDLVRGGTFGFSSTGINFNKLQAIAMVCHKINLSSESFPASPTNGQGWVFDTNSSILFMYSSALTKWVPFANFAACTIHVGSTGSSANHGYASGSKLDTIQAGWDAIPGFVYADVTLQIYNDGGSSPTTYTEDLTFAGKVTQGAAVIRVLGEWVDSASVTVGSATNNTVTRSSGTWTASTGYGTGESLKFVRLTSGSSVDKIAAIKSNTTTVLTIANRWQQNNNRLTGEGAGGNPAANDTLVTCTPGVLIDGSVTISGQKQLSLEVMEINDALVFAAGADTFVWGVEGHLSGNTPWNGDVSKAWFSACIVRDCTSIGLFTNQSTLKINGMIFYNNGGTLYPGIEMRENSAGQIFGLIVDSSGSHGIRMITGSQARTNTSADERACELSNNGVAHATPASQYGINSEDNGVFQNASVCTYTNNGSGANTYNPATAPSGQGNT